MGKRTSGSRPQLASLSFAPISNCARLAHADKDHAEIDQLPWHELAEVPRGDTAPSFGGTIPELGLLPQLPSAALFEDIGR